MEIAFHGAAGCVTGFCAKIDLAGTSVLVDCGMFQGSKTLKALNYAAFPFDPAGIDAVLLTHAHIDHSGLLPKLMRAGFDGPIYATAGARDLCAVMLPDAGDIQEKEVEQLNRRNQRRGRAPVAPIYTARDAHACMAQFRSVKLGEAVEAAPGVTAVFWEAGHILGSASVELRVEGPEGPVSILFSGDLGPGGRDYFPDPKGPEGVDHLVIESTYGDRERPPLDPAARRRMLAAELREAHRAGGPVLIPAFAVERSQELLADMLSLMASGEAPPADIFLDSPLAIAATEVFLRRGWNVEAGHNPFATIGAAERIKFLEKPWESDGLDRLSGWHVIVAASGMCEAGRVRKHLKRLLWRRDATVLLSGYQAVGTLGRLLVEGAQHVRIQGEDVRVRARVRSLDVYSGHADANALVAWAKARAPVRGDIFLTHGEPSGLDGLRARLADAGFDADRLVAPAMDARYSLLGRAVEVVADHGERIAPEAAAALDWHNARTALLIALDEALERAGSDPDRMGLLRRLSNALG